MDFRKETYQIEPLKGYENYSIWKVLMEHILRHLEVWEYVMGEIPQLADTADKDEKKKWLKGNHTALMAIYMRLTSEVIQELDQVTVAADAWKALKNTYMPSSIYGRV